METALSGNGNPLTNPKNWDDQIRDSRRKGNDQWLQ